MNTEILTESLKYENPSNLLKDLYNSNGTKNQKIVNHVNNALINLRNAVNRKEIPKNENPDKVLDIVEEILKVNKQQKGKRLPLNLTTSLKILSPKQMLQRFPIAFAQLQASNTSEELLDEIRQIIYYLYSAKEIIQQQKVYNNIMSSIKV